MSSEVDVNLTLALRRVAEVLRAGHRPPHHQRHWTKLQVKQHVAQGAIHAEKVLLKVPSDEDDLGHAAARLLLTLELRERSRAEKEQACGRRNY